MTKTLSLYEELKKHRRNRSNLCDKYQSHVDIIRDYLSDGRIEDIRQELDVLESVQKECITIDDTLSVLNKEVKNKKGEISAQQAKKEELFLELQEAARLCDFNMTTLIVDTLRQVEDAIRILEEELGKWGD